MKHLLIIFLGLTLSFSANAQDQETVMFIVNVDGELLGCYDREESVALIDTAHKTITKPFLYCGFFTVSKSDYLKSAALIVENDTHEFQLSIFHNSNSGKPLSYVVRKIGNTYQCDIFYNSKGMLSSQPIVKRK